MRYFARGSAVLLAAAVLVSGCTGNSVNHPPVIGSSEPAGDASLPEDGALLFRVTASDPDGQALSCRWYVDGNLTYRSAKPFAFNYTPGRATGVHTLRVVVSDGSLTAWKAWKVTVYDINHAPVIDAFPAGANVSVKEGAGMQFSANATDPDGGAVRFRWTLDGHTVAENTSAYRFEPDFTMAGAHVLKVEASDGNATAEKAWSVAVANTNRAPRLVSWSPPADLHLVELGSALFCASAVDDDGDPVQYRWTLDGTPAGDGPAFNYTTNYFSAGNHTVAVAATDGGLSTDHSWSVRVDNLNRPPRITGFEPQGGASVSEYGVLGLSVACADDDGDALSVSWFVDNGTEPAGTGGTFNYTPGYDAVGDHTITAVVSDGTDTVRHTWTVRVFRAVAEWTVLVYMNADCDLEPYLVEDFNEMELAGSTGNVSIVVQVDRHPAYDATSGDWNGTRRYRVEKDPEMRAMNSRLLEDLGELDMGDQKTLSDFLLWGREKFPARRTLVVLSGHGEGWPGISQDFTDQNDRLSLDELSAGLGDFTRSRGAPIDVLLLDVCYWAMLETDWALRNLTSYIVASEDIDPSAGQRYDAFLGGLVKEPGMAPRDLAMEIVASFREAYSSGGYYHRGSETFTLSAVETARLGPLASALDGLADLLEGNLSALAPAVKAARGAVETYGKPEYIDLGDFVSGLRSRSADDGLNDSADAVLSALNDTVAARAGGTLRTRSRGISIYFPSQSFSYRTSYADLSFSGEHSWDALLKAYHNATGRSAQGRSGGAGQAGAPALPEPPHLSVSERKGLYVPSAESQRFTFAGGS
jgi:hypothetical protein